MTVRGKKKCRKCRRFFAMSTTVCEECRSDTPTPAASAGPERQFSRCVWCAAEVEWFASDDREAAEAKLREHSATCPEHPAVKELAALRSLPREGEAAVAWRWRYLRANNGFGTPDRWNYVEATYHLPATNAPIEYEALARAASPLPAPETGREDSVTIPLTMADDILRASGQWELHSVASHIDWLREQLNELRAALPAGRGSEVSDAK